MKVGSKYVVTDGRNYMCVNKDSQQETTGNINMAQVFDTYSKAENFTKSIKRTLQMFKWEVKEYETKEVIVEQKTNKLTDTNIRTTVIINDIDMNGIVNKIKEVEIFTKQLKTKQQEYTQRFTTITQEIIDIEHAAEFYKLNAVQGYRIYKMLHDARIERRTCKDGLAKISYILDGNFQDCFEEKITHQIEGMDHRQYRPRVLNELFNV